MDHAELVTELSTDEGISPTIKPDGNFSSNWRDMGTEIEKIKAEKGLPSKKVEENPLATSKGSEPMTPTPVSGEVNLEAKPEVKAQPAQPVVAATTEPVTPAPAAPAKFVGPDGTLNQEKLLKSYLEMEPQFKRLQNEVRTAQSQAPAPAPANVQPQNQENLSFEAMIEQDVQREGVGRTLAKLFHASKEAAKTELLGHVTDIRQHQERDVRTRELQAIAQIDPWVFSEEGVKTLSEIRQTRPWINNSPEPWKEAYMAHLGNQAIQQRVSPAKQVSTPSPQAVTAPIAPVTAASVAPTTVKLDTPEDIKAHLGKLTAQQEAEFWKKSGFKWSTPRMV